MGSNIDDRARWRSRLLTLGAIAVLTMAAVISSVVYMKFLREPPATHFESDEDHFLFGSTGIEREHGIPYWIWLVLPRVFPEHLPRPGGYAALGMVSRQGNEMPAGFSRTTIGYPRVGVNCALCHTARWRERPTSPPMIVPAGPAHQTDAQAYRRFLIACAADDRFNAATILGEIARNYRLSLLDRVLYRFFIIPSTRRRLLALDLKQWMHARTEWGQGRADVVNDAKFWLLRRPIDNSIGTADNVPLWNLQQREGKGLFWDGSNPSLKESVVFSALAMGITPGWLYDVEASLTRVRDYIAAVRPPAYPFPVDQASAQHGRAVFDTACAGCHAPGGGRIGAVIRSAELGTDRHRLDAWSAEDVRNLNAIGTGRDWKFSAFRESDGYVAVPLDGIWLRGPFLHNGSVPSLADLLEPPERRPRQFWRGYDVYDPVKVGFVSSGVEAERIGTLHDVSRPGNGNGGHVFGTALPAEDKRALLEFLKTQ
jgi:mono/diheme cytochrome c family protein